MEAKRCKSSLASSPMEAGDVVFEIMSRLDAASLARACCVCNLWRSVGSDEQLWEALCVLHWPAGACKSAAAAATIEQIRCVVAGLGGFRSFFSSRLGPIVGRWSSRRRNLCNSSRRKKWGSDEVHLSLSLYSIDCFMKRDSNCVRATNAGAAAAASTAAAAALLKNSSLISSSFSSSSNTKLSS